MFYAQMFVHDRHLVQFMHAISGLALDLKILPATNVEANSNGNGVVKAATNARNLTELLAGWLKDKKGETLVAKDIGDWLKSIGRSKGSKTYLAGQAVNAGLLKKVGTGPGTSYVVKHEPGVESAPVVAPKRAHKKKAVSKRKTTRKKKSPAKKKVTKKVPPRKAPSIVPPIAKPVEAA